MLQRLKRFWWVGVIVAVLGVGVAGYLLFFAPGHDTPEAAALAAFGGEDAELLTSRDWGDGQLMLVRSIADGERLVGLAFVSETGRGWRADAFSANPTLTDDVVVASLLIASHGGGGGQPAWTAAVGELSDRRVDSVQVAWSAGDTTDGRVAGGAYLVVTAGQVEAEEARYRAADGTVIATVPVG